LETALGCQKDKRQKIIEIEYMVAATFKVALKLNIRLVIALGAYQH
jgi:hypothetical protein